MVRQGCLLLPYLPILSVEVLAAAIRGDNEIRGISVRNVKCKFKKLKLADGKVISHVFPVHITR